MSLSYVILAALSQGPASGYQIKKLVADTPILPWSGNNNQIYRSLVDLERQGFVSVQVIHQDHGPTKKVHALTPAGKENLRTWLLREPEDMPFQNDLVTRLLAWPLLEAREIEALIRAREEQVYGQRRIMETVALPLQGSAEDLARELLLDLRDTELAWLRRCKARLLLAGGLS